MQNPIKAPIDKEKIAGFFGGSDCSFLVFDRLDSTNKYLKEIGVREDEGLVIIAEEQTGGRGRLGREFSSPRGGLYMSVLLRPELSPEDFALLTPTAALAAAQAIESVTGVKTQIKWVNDIYTKDGKAAGILFERVTGERGFSVLGIGINVTTRPSDFPPELSNRAASLYPEGCEKPDLFERLAAEVCREFFALYKNFDRRKIAAEYKRRALPFLCGREVTVLSAGQSYNAVVFDIDENCRLGVKHRDGSETEEYLFCGEVSLSL